MLLYRAMYESIAAHSRLGVNVVVDVGHHDAYSVPRGILPDCARRLRGPAGALRRRALPARRRHGAPARDLGRARTESSVVAAGAALARGRPRAGIYDLEVDTSMLSPDECADAIAGGLEDGPPPEAFARLARGG